MNGKLMQTATRFQGAFDVVRAIEAEKRGFGSGYAFSFEPGILVSSDNLFHPLHLSAGITYVSLKDGGYGYLTLLTFTHLSTSQGR